jgi:hypothetical protein
MFCVCNRASRSDYRYFLRKLRKVKKANGQILAANEVGRIFILTAVASCNVYDWGVLACSQRGLW